WVGMAGIALPVRIDTAGGGAPLLAPASVDVSVDLRDASARGIHMSRLYLRLQEALASEPPRPRRPAARAAGLHRFPARAVGPRPDRAALRPHALAQGPVQRPWRLEDLPGGDRGRTGGGQA